MMTCLCISHNRPEPWQTEPERVLVVPEALRAAIGRDSIAVDACVADLVLDLWGQGFVTHGVCCGHSGTLPRSVVVEAEQAAAVKAFLVARGETMAVMCWRLVEEVVA